MRRCPPALLATAVASVLAGSALARTGSALAWATALLAGTGSLLAMVPVSTRAVRSASTWVCRDQVLAGAGRGVAGRSAAVASPLGMAPVLGGGRAAGGGGALLLLAKKALPPNRLPNRSQPPLLAGALAGSSLSAAAGAVAAGPSPQGCAAEAVRVLSRVAAVAGCASPAWPRPASW